MHYCLQCGRSLELRLQDGRHREVCGNCGWIYYEQLKVGAGILIEKDARLLLLQRTGEPWQADWNLPAGFVEMDEDPRDAARREALEETGLDVEVGELVRVYFYTDDPRGNGIMLVYCAKSAVGQIKTNDEVHVARYFAWPYLPENLAGGGHDKAILDWCVAAQENNGSK